MKKRAATPMTDDEGEARPLTAAERKWTVFAGHFPDFETTMAFMTERETFLRAAEDAGVPRTAFLGLQPNKPGFIERATAAMLAIAKAGRHAAE
jgi:hypothetical protein